MIKRWPAALLTISLAGLALLGAEEGNGPLTTTADGAVIAHAYPDAAHGWAVPTICDGHTLGVFKGQNASLAQCQTWLVEDTSASGRAIKRCTPVEMTQPQYDALTILIHNIGQTAYCTSAIARQINAGNCRAAAAEFNAVPQIDRTTGKPRIWRGRPLIDRQSGAVLLATGDTVKKWTTANTVPLPGLIKRRAKERALFESGC